MTANARRNPPNPWQRAVQHLARALLARVSARVDDETSPQGWIHLDRQPNAFDLAQNQESYQDALTAWKKNPLAKRIVDTTTDYCLGDGLTPTAPGSMGAWIDTWWNHPKNCMPQRLPELSDELSRAGDLYLTLHRNPDDGLSYVRPIPKDRIVNIQTAENDWENELSYTEVRGVDQTIEWPSPANPEAPQAPAVMLHYRVNGVVGAACGESDLLTIVPWLLRYSRMMEDRVRLHWALKAFLWMVTVPPNMVQSKREQYNAPPDGGSVIVKDAQETWEPITPNLHAFDARYDYAAIRQLIDAGAGIPPHWRGEATDVNLATATAMERAATRHLRRRQLYLRHLVIDLTHHAYTRAYQIGQARRAPDRTLITCETTELNRQDNRDLANAAESLATAFQTVLPILPQVPEPIRVVVLELLFRFAGETFSADQIGALSKACDEITVPPAPALHGRTSPAQDGQGARP